MSEAGPPKNETIKPVTVPLTAHAPVGQFVNAEKRPSWREQPLLIACLVAIVGLTLAVIFVLPGKISSTDSAVEVTTLSPAPAPTPKLLNDSPFSDAQLAKARKGAQETLELLLAKQNALETIAVESWATEPYQTALELAKNADGLYREQRFVEAQTKYQQVLDQFTQLESQSESVFTDALTAGFSAIENGDSAEAKKQFGLAQKIKPNNRQLKDGQQRASVLDEVLQSLKNGREFERQQELTQAREQYQKALNLDPQSAEAQQRATRITQMIVEQNFARAMSEGFGALNQNRFDAAIAAFTKAGKIKPGSAEAKAALTQATNSSIQSQVQSLLSSAQKNTVNENWNDAVENYKAVLKLDSNAVSARVGLIQAQERQKIDSKLAAILSDPLPLATPNVHQEYQVFYRDTLKIAQPGPKLSRQLEGLQLALQQAVAPVQIQLRSDNLTEVTLYRIGELGLFTLKQLELTPGRYTVVGSRNGYRDVRQEFEVLPGKPITISIQCSEEVTRG